MTTLKYSAIPNIHTSQIITAHTKSFQPALSSPVASIGGDSLASTLALFPVGS
jgi:hypothetical protein